MSDTAVPYNPDDFEAILDEFPLPPNVPRRVFYNDTEEQIIELLGGDPHSDRQPEFVLDRLQDSIDNAETDLERDEFTWLMAKLEEANM